MYLQSYHRSVRSQCGGLEETAQAVMRPLERGVRSFIRVTEMLLGEDEDMVLPDCQTYRDIRRQIVKMKDELEESEQVAKVELCHLDRESELLIVQQSKLARKKRRKEGELERLKTQLESHRSSLRRYEEALQTEKRNLSSAEDTLDSMRRRRDEAETMAKVGLGIMLIPVVGWIPGAFLTVAGAIEHDKAVDAVRTARREVESSQSQVSSYSDRVSDCNSSISEAQEEIRETDSKIYETKAKLQDMSERRRLAAELQSKLRKTVTRLGVLCGRGRAAESHTRLIIMLEPLMGILEEMASALSQVFRTELLYTQGLNSLNRLMRELRGNLDELKQLPDTDSSQALSDYY